MSYDKWIVRKLGEITINHDKKRIPLSTMERTSRKGKYPYYGAQGIIDYIDDYIFEGRYLLIAEDGANLQTRNQDIALLTSLIDKFWVNNHAHILSSNELSDIRYIMYYLNYYDISGYITGSAQPKLNQSNLNNIEIKLPSLQEQKAIANILSSLDDKIELNNKINKNLEELAQTLYKRWFVEFEFPNEDGEPYKSSGGEMVESELRMIPKGWSVIEFGDIFDFIKGKKPSQLSKIREKGYKPYLTIANIENNERNYADTNGTVLVSKYETIMVMDGGSSGKIFYGLSGILGSTMSVLISKRHDIKMFILLTSKFNETDIREKTTGSAIPHTDKEFVKRIKISISDEYTKLFEKMVTPIFDKIINNRFEIQNLVQVRDELLPKLMNGEIEVPIEE